MEGSNGAAETPAQKEAVKTEYVVLCQNKDDNGFSVVASVKAHGGENAIKGVADRGLQEGEETGTFVAVPARSWKPMKVKVEVKRSVELSGA